ncbi:hypothetical protein V1504DRAFT_436887 [Lipomyces starkeyi]
MVLSLCAFSLIQPVHVKERASIPSRQDQAQDLLQMAAKMRSAFDFGEHLSIEATLTSFFMFGALFGLHLQNAAWLQLRQAVECGRLLGLDKPESYQGLALEDASERLVVFSRLLNEDLPCKEITYKLHRQTTGANAREPTGVIIHDDRSATALLGLFQLLKLCNSVNEGIIPCWNNNCSKTRQPCSRLRIDRVSQIFHSIEYALDADSDPDDLEAILRAQVSCYPGQRDNETLLSDIQQVDYIPGSRFATGQYVLSARNQDLVFSLPLVGAIVGAIIAAPLTTRFGRKWPIVDVCTSLGAFVSGRCFNAILMAISMTIVPLYLSEVVPAKHRGKAVTSMNIFNLLSGVIGTLIANATHDRPGRSAYQISVALQAAMPTILIPLTCFVPESPMWFIMRGKDKEARKILHKLRADSPQTSRL